MVLLLIRSEREADCPKCITLAINREEHLFRAVGNPLMQTGSEQFICWSVLTTTAQDYAQKR
jgi:hypothetical protein